MTNYFLSTCIHPLSTSSFTSIFLSLSLPLGSRLKAAAAQSTSPITRPSSTSALPTPTTTTTTTSHSWHEVTRTTRYVMWRSCDHIHMSCDLLYYVHYVSCDWFFDVMWPNFSGLFNWLCLMHWLAESLVAEEWRLTAFRYVSIKCDIHYLCRV